MLYYTTQQASLSMAVLRVVHRAGAADCAITAAVALARRVTGAHKNTYA
jgi:predicted SpoU family rRNA methylase